MKHIFLAEYFMRWALPVPDLQNLGNGRPPVGLYKRQIHFFMKTSLFLRRFDAFPIAINYSSYITLLILVLSNFYIGKFKGRQSLIPAYLRGDNFDFDKFKGRLTLISIHFG